MVGMAEITHESEIIFPEIAALCIGALISPKQSWQTSRLKLVGLIMISSIAGVAIVRSPIDNKYIEILLAFIVGAFLLEFSQTTFAPLMSAIVLPVLLDTSSPIYPISAITMAIIITISQAVLERKAIRQPSEYVRKVFSNNETSIWLKRFLIVAILTIPAIFLNITFLIAPPLIVGFIEVTNNNSKILNRKKYLMLLILIASIVGVSFRYISNLGIPMFLCAMISCLVIVLIENKLDLYFPPAGAIAILPMIIPYDDILWYPIEVCIGFGFMLISAKYLFKKATTPV